MSRINLTDLNDPRIDVFRDLTTRNHTRLSERFIAEGRLVVTRLLASSFETESVLVEERLTDEFLRQAPQKTPVYVTPNGSLKGIAGFDFHRGVLACGRLAGPAKLEDLAAPWKDSATLTVCPNVQDPENLGVILRASTALGVDAALVGPQSAYPYSRRVLRVSMAAVLKLPILDSSQLLEDLIRLREKFDVQLVAAVLDETAEPLERAARAPRTALLFGAEGHGLPPEYIAAADRRVTLSMKRETDSLNVASAASVFLYHFQRIAH